MINLTIGGKLMKNNKKTSFLVKVDYTNNNSMQGSLHWLEENKVVRFKSMMELMELMALALPDKEPLQWDDTEKVLNIEKQLDNEK